jgi:hypothetical protein
MMANMRTTDDSWHDSSDDFAAPYVRRLASVIIAHGFAVVPVGYGGCSDPACCGPRARHPWTYSVGLAGTGHPEVVLMGLAPTSAHFAISWVAGEQRAGRPAPVGEPFTLEGVRVKLIEVPSEWLLTDPSRMAMWFAHYDPTGRSERLPAVRQLVWADADGRFPDDADCDAHVVRQQPLLDVPPFRYPEPPPRQQRRAARHRRRAA